jgi:hypothetical protein
VTCAALPELLLPAASVSQTASVQRRREARVRPQPKGKRARHAPIEVLAASTARTTEQPIALRESGVELSGVSGTEAHKETPSPASISQTA